MSDPADPILIMTLDPPREDSLTVAGFGKSVALDGNIALVGANLSSDVTFHGGSAYLFDISTGNVIEKLLPDLGVPPNTVFGWSAALDGQIALVGAKGDDPHGSVRFYEASSGDFLSEFLPPEPSFISCGWSVDIQQEKALIGHPGTAKTFLVDSESGDILSTLKTEDGDLSEEFGKAVALSGDRAVVGAPFDVSDFDIGHVYVFDVSTPCPADLDGSA